MSEQFERWSVGLEDVLGVPPAPAALFLEAFTHSSFANEQPDPRPPDNERLEFLGDAVIDLAVSDELWRRFPDRPEGALARARTALVNTEILAQRGRRLNLGRWLRLGKGETKSGGRQRDSILCDTFEAVVGAIFVAYGWHRAATFVLDQLQDDLDRVERARAPGLDAKTRLQEQLHRIGADVPLYVVTDIDGPDHRLLFTVDVVSGGRPLGTGQGRSKRVAEQAAARDALARMGLERSDKEAGQQRTSLKQGGTD